MKTRTLTLKILPCIFAAGILFAACQKSDRTATRNYPAAVQNQVISVTNDYYAFDEDESDDFDMIMGYGEYSDGTTELRPGCYTITYVPSKNVLPHQRIIDFGDGCYTPNGKIFKKGKIIVTKYDPDVTGGKLATLEYDGYQVNGFKWAGSQCVYVLTNSHGQPVRRIVEAKKKIDCGNGDYNEYISDRDFTQTAGAGTDSKSDDEFDICGISLGRQSVGGVTSDIYESNVALNNHLKQIYSCSKGRKTIQGSVNIRLHIQCTGFDILNEVLDYGDGTCDATRTLYIEGVPTAVDFPIQAWPY